MSRDVGNEIGYYQNYPERTKKWVDTYIIVNEHLPKHLIPKPRIQLWDDDLIVEPDEVRGELGQRNIEINQLLDGIGIVEAYQRWSNKSAIGRKKGQGRELWARCPMLNHPDKDPSCHISPEEPNGGLWHCFSCEAGGDKYDLAAIKHGFNLDDIHRKGSSAFHQLCEVMAEDLGYVYVEDAANPKGEPLLRPKEGSEIGETSKHLTNELPEPSSPPSGTPKASSLVTADPDLRDNPLDVYIDWRSLCPTGTPLYEWMRETSKTALPDEYLFWLGLSALGLAVGHNVFIHSNPPIYANFYILLFGPSGSGKSRAVYLFEDLVTEAMPYDYRTNRSPGAFRAGEPGSGPAMYGVYNRTFTDDDNQAQPVEHLRAIWTIQELSTLMAKANQSGSTFTGTVNTLFDNPTEFIYRLRSGDLIIKHPWCSIAAGVQPQAIASSITIGDIHSGFMNRWIPARAIIKATPDEEYVPDLGIATRAYHKLWNGWGAREHEVRWDRQARQNWRAFEREHIDPLKQDEVNRAAAMYTRVDLMLMKVMLAFAVNERSEVITPDIVQRVTQLFGYLIACYDTLTGRIERHPTAECAERIIREMKQAGEPLTIGKLNDRVVRVGSHERSVFVTTLKLLIDGGELENGWFKKHKGGRRAHYYMLPEQEIEDAVRVEPPDEES